MRCVGTVVRGIRTPIIKENDDLATIVVDSLMAAKESEGFEFRDKDIVAITEAVVGISEGNYVTVDDVAQDLQNKFPSKNIGVVNPILSRNREKILNRTEFRIVECDNKYSYEIAPHKSDVDFGCNIITSAQGGPMILPQLRLEEEFFIVKDSEGKIIPSFVIFVVNVELKSFPISPSRKPTLYVL